MSMRIHQYHSLRESGIDVDEVMSGDSDHRDLDTKGTEFWCWVCVGFGSVLFAVFSFSAFVSKILPPFENPILAAIQRDNQETDPTNRGYVLVDFRTAKATASNLPEESRVGSMLGPPPVP
ncbi:hypothetical protein AKJ16_DCAP01627 [Drosera capensis]